MNNNKRLDVKKLALTALMTALCYIGFTYFRIDIPIAGGQTSIHFGNAFLVLASLLLGGVYGGVAGAIGMGIGDLFVPAYIMYAPKTIIIKFLIGLICGIVAHKLGKINTNPSLSHKNVIKWSIIAATTAMAFNVIFDPIVGYFYSQFILGIPSSAAKILTTWAAGATTFNAITSVIISTTLFSALRPALMKSGLHSFYVKESQK